MRIDKNLEDKIIIDIATYFPFSIEDIKCAYSFLGSFDATIKACEVACELGYGSPFIALKALQGKYSLVESKKVVNSYKAITL